MEFSDKEVGRRMLKSNPCYTEQGASSTLNFKSYQIFDVNCSSESVKDRLQLSKSLLRKKRVCIIETKTKYVTFDL
jgi:hypothetical protein